MPTNVTPTNGPWVTPLQIPSDGEGISSASVLAYVQEIANRLEFLRQRVPGANPVANLLRLQVAATEAYIPSGPEWTRAAATPTNAPACVTSVVSTVPILFPLEVFAGQIIQGYGCLLRGFTGHAALPAVMPTLALIYVDVTTAGGAADPTIVTANGPVVDPSANTAAYQVNHAMGNSGIAHTVVAGRQYYLRFIPESGANSLTGLRVHNAYIDVSA